MNCIINILRFLKRKKNKFTNRMSALLRRNKRSLSNMTCRKENSVNVSEKRSLVIKSDKKKCDADKTGNTNNFGIEAFFSTNLPPKPDSDSETIQEFVSFVRQGMQERKEQLREFEQQSDQLMEQMSQMANENNFLRKEVQLLKTIISAKFERIDNLENLQRIQESCIDLLNERLQKTEKRLQDLKLLLNRKSAEKKQKTKSNSSKNSDAAKNNKAFNDMLEQEALLPYNGNEVSLNSTEESASISVEASFKLESPLVNSPESITETNKENKENHAETEGVKKTSASASGNLENNSSGARAKVRQMGKVKIRQSRELETILQRRRALIERQDTCEKVGKRLSKSRPMDFLGSASKWTRYSRLSGKAMPLVREKPSNNVKNDNNA